MNTETMPLLLRRAAILIASLDSTEADQMLRGLPPDEADRLRRAVRSLGPIGAEERAAVVNEFRAANRQEPRPARRHEPLNQMAGIELDGLLARQLAGADVGHQEPTPAASAAPARFQFLEEAESESLAGHLALEHPQVIATVVAHLSDDLAARVLVELPNRVQVEVLRRLETLDSSDPESLAEIERQLEAWMARQSQYRRRRSTGLAAVSRILRAADPSSREMLLDNVRRRDVGLSMRLADDVPANPLPSVARQTSVPTPAPPRVEPKLAFEDLAFWSAAALRDLISDAEPELLVLALAGVEEDVQNHFVSALPPHVGTALRRALGELGPTRIGDVETAQREFVKLAAERLARPEQRARRERLSVAA